MFLARLDAFARIDCLLDPNRLTLVGLSGGPDSLSLLDGLRRLDFRLAAAYFHHSLRPEADQEANQLGERMAAWDIPYYCARDDVRDLAHRDHLSIEEAARKSRYRFLFAQARQLGAQAVAVGHTADDQVESVLMHFIQGAGLTGLKGMSARSLAHGWNTEIPLVRPLLKFWKEDTLAYCRDQDLHPFLDATNEDPIYLRNRLRKEVIPLLEAINPSFRQALERSAETFTADHDYIQSQVDAAWELCCRKRERGAILFSRQRVLSQPLSLQRGLVRRAYTALAADPRNLGFEIVEQALAWIERPPQKGQANLAGGLRILCRADEVIFANWEAELPSMEWPQIDATCVLQLPSPGVYLCGSGWQIQVSLEANSSPGWAVNVEAEDLFGAILDASWLAWPLEVRCRRPGDRFQPLGMGGHSQSLSDFWINEKLPRRARAGWPLVCSQGKIAWVPGFRPAEQFRVTADTSQIARFQLSRREE